MLAVCILPGCAQSSPHEQQPAFLGSALAVLLTCLVGAIALLSHHVRPVKTVAVDQMVCGPFGQL